MQTVAFAQIAAAMRNHPETSAEHFAGIDSHLLK